MVYANVYHSRPEQYEAIQDHRCKEKPLPSRSSGGEAAITSSKKGEFLFRGILSIFIIGMPFFAFLVFVVVVVFFFLFSFNSLPL